MQTLAFVLLGILAAMGALVLLGLLRIRRARRRLEARIAALDPVRAATAALFGRASLGKAQVRGLGTLVLTEDELVFMPLLGGDETRVLRSAVTSTSTTRHFLGKTTGRDLLVVTWDHLGAGDAMAFDVPDIDGWRTTLRS